MAATSRSRVPTRARSAARRLAMQALYEVQLNEQPWQDLHKHYLEDEEGAQADPAYFRELLENIVPARAQFDEALEPYIDRAPGELDPVEHAILFIGLYELKSRIDVPYRVVINEAVELARRFGATDGYKFVNAVLDRAAAELRALERGQ